MRIDVKGDAEAHRQLAAAADALNARVATVHERRYCPTCFAAVGYRCHNVRTGKPLKHPHADRVRADGIPLR